MSEFNEQDNIIEEETPVLHLELEDGTEQDCAVIALFSVEELNDQEYIALVSVEDLESEDEESALLYIVITKILKILILSVLITLKLMKNMKQLLLSQMKFLKMKNN